MREATRYGARVSELAKYTEIGVRTGGLKVGKFKKYCGLTGRGEQIQKMAQVGSLISRKRKVCRNICETEFYQK